jgi:hypothetical protein
MAAVLSMLFESKGNVMKTIAKMKRRSYRLRKHALLNRIQQ